MENQTASKKKSKKGIIIGAVTAVVLIAVGVIVFLNLPKKEADPLPVNSSHDGRGIILTKDNMDELIQEAAKVDDGFFEACMSNEWTFNDGVSDPETVYVKNEITNTNLFYFDLFVNNGDQKDIIYSSPYISIGAELSEFSLDKELEEGYYEGVVEYHLVDENYEEVSTVSIAVRLHINNERI